MTALGMRTALCAAALAVVAAAQDPSRAVPGRYLVTLRDRSFDLDAYRQAVAGHAPAAAVDGVLANLDASMRADQAPVVQAVEALGGRAVAQWWIVNGLAVELADARADELRKHPRVAAVVPDEVRVPGIKTSTNAANHATDLVQAMGIRGAGVAIAVIDSGVDQDMAGTGRPHATFFIDGDINNRNGGGIGGSRLLANVQLGQMGPDDLINHGTAVAGVAGGARWNTSAVADDGHAPRAQVVSYCVANDVAGGTLASILTTAWQQVAIDRVRFNIVVANCSYEGTFDLRFTDQTAIDVVAYQANVTITGMAGNGGTGSGYGYGATNMLAVGACEHDNRRLAPFSLRGPAWLEANRYYPDMIANGVAIAMPSADAEAQSRSAQGTSYSCAQVAGAAALFRSVVPSANAMEVRAAILASTEDVLDRQAAADQNRNAIGHGYLRTDRLIHVAASASIRTTAVATAGQTLQFPLPVRAGRDYGIAVAWFRDATNQPSLGSWSNLDLELWEGSNLIAQQATTRNLDELIRHRASANAQLTVRVLPTRLEGGRPQPFALVAVESPVVTGQLNAFGTSCGRLPLLRTAGAPAPEVGASYWIDCSPTGTNPLIPMAMLIGASNARFQQFALPFDLGPVGAPGCFLRVSPDVVVPVPPNLLGGVTRMTFPVPAQPELIGRSLYHQGALVAPYLNALGIDTSNGIEAVLGGRR